MSPETFIAKWKDSTLKERSAAQSHFNDLCDVLGVEKPTDVDQKGDWYCFERGASKTAGGVGWADVWKRGHFGWEYKGKRKDLTAAYAQLQQYAVALENPPLLVVSDMDRIIVHTNWTNTVSEVHTIQLEELKNAGKRELLRWVFTAAERLKPSKTVDALTREAADKFAGLAIQLHTRGHDPHQVAHFVNRLVFWIVPGFPDRIIPVDNDAAQELRRRTLTNLYNDRPAWLDNAHKALDAAVAAAYGWPFDLSDEEILSRLLALNLERSAPAEAPTAKQEFPAKVKALAGS